MTWQLMVLTNIAFGATLMVFFDRGAVMRWCLQGWKWPRMLLAALLWPISLWFAIRQ